MWIFKPTPSIQLQKYRHSESSLSIIPGRGFITLRRHLGTRNMSPQWAVEGLWSEEEGEEGEESGADLTHLAWFAIIAPSLSVLERPSRHTIWTQLPTVYQWPLSPPPHPRHSSTLRKPACSPVGGWDVPCLIKRGCGPLMNTVSISLLLLLPLIIMQCSMKEHCHPGDMIFIVCAADGGRGGVMQGVRVRGQR